MFNGSLLSTPGTNHPFSKLQVFDVSLNSFTGSLPTRYLKNFIAMMDAKENRSNQLIWFPYYKESLALTLNGLEQSLERMLTTFTMIDLSSNRFSGSIPNSIGNLNSLIYLNLSHNCITGHIPASLGSVSALESLDLSSNQLVGNIPAQLTKLTFLSRLNLSMNNLSGKIPQSGGQFPTFDNSSYSGNLALCGFPLTQKCGDDNKPPSIQILQQKRDGSDFLHGFCWQALTLGYGYGFIFGVMSLL
ncbi:hypothetical protein C2S51_037378 [Perilla frutescens var. frutescens]|nr:hypothetical protein C2S51_037378 [Perilla frutescens var. frutescens]